MKESWLLFGVFRWEWRELPDADGVIQGEGTALAGVLAGRASRGGRQGRGLGFVTRGWSVCVGMSHHTEGRDTALAHACPVSWQQEPFLGFPEETPPSSSPCPG